MDMNLKVLILKKINQYAKVQERNTVTDLSKRNFDKSEFYDGFYSTLYNSNFRTLKCFKLLLSFF